MNDEIITRYDISMIVFLLNINLYEKYRCSNTRGRLRNVLRMSLKCYITSFELYEIIWLESKMESEYIKYRKSYTYIKTEHKIGTQYKMVYRIQIGYIFRIHKKLKILWNDTIDCYDIQQLKSTMFSKKVVLNEEN